MTGFKPILNLYLHFVTIQFLLDFYIFFLYVIIILKGINEDDYT